MRRIAVCVGAFLGALAFPAGAVEEGRNWFGDPYFQLTREIAPCPEPLGSLITEDEALRESHHRSERGTRCHLEGRCRHPSSYDYDREIAESIRRAAGEKGFAPHPSTLWVLVQGRRVRVYGCVPAGYRRGHLEKALRRIPDVELAMEEVRIGDRGRIGYRTRSAPRDGPE